MKYKDYIEPSTDLQKLEATYVTPEVWKTIHKNMPILCHDVFIRYTYEGVQGILLVKRLNLPARGNHWPIGGRILRGVETEDSLRQKTKEECSLTLEEITFLGTSRTLFKDDPFGHGKGTDTLSLTYIANGKGDLVLDNVHETPLIVTQENYADLRPTLDEFVKDALDYIQENNLWN